jgi:hypothetical protein
VSFQTPRETENWREAGSALNQKESYSTSASIGGKDDGKGCGKFHLSIDF